MRMEQGPRTHEFSWETAKDIWNKLKSIFDKEFVDNAKWHHPHVKKSNTRRKISDNDHDSEEDASEPSDYEEYTDTDGEDTEEARSDI
ncbi:hypothetical protein JTB14_022891 [Gonioctena quinquepunctata]|nr:hypothetical protein JTB14_022891 [Gonioctena quinquepunctata]